VLISFFEAIVTIGNLEDMSVNAANHDDVFWRCLKICSRLVAEVVIHVDVQW
jgi:hypothetical protein